MFKGQKGRVTQVNGEEAIVELSTRPKKVAIPKEDLRESVFEESSQYRTTNAGGQSVYHANRGGFGGGNSIYGGAQTPYGNPGGMTAQYEAGKTPHAFMTPAQNYNGGQTPAAPLWGHQQGKFNIYLR